MFARNVSAVPDTGFMPTTPGLFCRCREGESLVIYDADTYIRGNFRSDTLPTSIRIDDRPAETQQWSKLPTSKGSGLFGVRAEAMMRRFLGAEKVFFRIEDGGQRYDASFDLAGIQPVVEKVAGALEQDDVLRPRTRLTGARLRWLEADGQALVDELNALADTDPGTAKWEMIQTAQANSEVTVGRIIAAIRAQKIRVYASAGNRSYHGFTVCRSEFGAIQ